MNISFFINRRTALSKQDCFNRAVLFLVFFCKQHCCILSVINYENLRRERFIALHQVFPVIWRLLLLVDDFLPLQCSDQFEDMQIISLDFQHINASPHEQLKYERNFLGYPRGNITFRRKHSYPSFL